MSDASYTCCDMGIFDFFRRSSSRSRSKTSAASSAASVTSSLSSDVSMVSAEADRLSLPEAPTKALLKESLDSCATTASVESSNNEDDGFGEIKDASNQGESLGSIQNYEIVRELGRGATAVVQLGKHKENDQLVALKVFKTSLLKKMREVKRVGRKMVVSTALDKVQVEIAIMKKLQHTNLLNLLEVLDDDSETLVLLLEYAPHGQIMQWDAATRRYSANSAAAAAGNGVFDAPALRKCVRQLLLGLEYLHQNAICHRDLKPENILLGADGVYKIADFGVAHIFAEDAAAGGDDSQTAKKGYVSSTAGTYAFMGPETLKGQAYSAYDADVWALGITIYALAFGRIPYYHPDVVALFEMIETQPLELGSGDNNDDSEIADGLAELLRGMLEKDPAQRWSIQKCKEHAWLHEDLDDQQKQQFVDACHDQVTVSEDDVARAVTRVTTMNVLLRVQLGANKWKRKAQKSLDMKKRASLSAPPTIDEHEDNNGQRDSDGDAQRASFTVVVATAKEAEQNETKPTVQDNQLEL